MKKQTIEAYNGTGKDKKLAGSREVDMPETTEEAVKLFGAAETMDYIKASYVIEVQRQIRAGTTISAKKQLEAIQAAARANPDIAKTLAALGITLEKEEVGNGEEKKEETPAPTPPAPEKEEAKPAPKGKGKK